MGHEGITGSGGDLVQEPVDVGVAAQLFLSARTVGHHLYKAYPKLGVASRAELAGLELG